MLTYSNLTLRRKYRGGRTNSGAVSAEFAASLALMLPVVLVVLYACYEVAVALMIYNALDHSAHLGALALSKAYGGDPTYAVSVTKQNQVLSNITFAHVVVSSNQFEVQFPNAPATASWMSNSGNVPAVTVLCTYAGGQYGLPPFPNPDLLQLRKQFKLQASATAYLEGF
jgi:hypothetical protein